MPALPQLRLDHAASKPVAVWRIDHRTGQRRGLTRGVAAASTRGGYEVRATGQWSSQPSSAADSTSPSSQPLGLADYRDLLDRQQVVAHYSKTSRRHDPRATKESRPKPISQNAAIQAKPALGVEVTQGHSSRRNPLNLLASRPGLAPGTYGLTAPRELRDPPEDIGGGGDLVK